LRRAIVLLSVLASARGAAAQEVGSIGRVARYAAPLGAPYAAEEVRVRAPGGVSLAGTLTIPKNGLGPHPAVVLITGASAQDRDMRNDEELYRPFFQIADTLSRRGIAVLRLDDRGVGASTGTLDSTTTADRAEDMRAAVAYLRTRPQIAHLRLGVVGFSEGGMIAAMMAATDPKIRAIVLMAAPGEPGSTIVEWQTRRSADADTTLTAARRDSVFAAAMKSWRERAERDPWTRYFAGYDPIPTARLVAKTSVLILQGTADESVPARDAELLAAAFKAGGNTDVTVRRFDGRTHAFLRATDFSSGGAADPRALEMSRDVLGAIADWLSQKLK